MILTKENIASVDFISMIDNYVRQENFQKFLLVVPTNRKLRRVKKELISRSPSGTVDNLNVETISTLSQKLLSEVEIFSLLSEGAKSVLIRQCSEKVKLRYFSSFKNLPFGTLDRISNVISEYKKNGVSPEHLKREVENSDLSEKEKAHDIAAIYDLFSKKCKELKAFEIGDIYDELLSCDKELLSQSFEKYYMNVEAVFFDGFNEFTNPESEIISRLSMIEGIKIFISFDYYEKNPAIFGHIDQSYHRLVKRGFRAIPGNDQSTVNKFIDYLRGNLFVSDENKLNREFEKDIIVIEAKNRDNEITAIAKEIKRLILFENVDPGDICVGFNLVKNYSSQIRDKFEIFGIPLNLTDRINLDNSMPVVAIVNLLEIVETRYFYKNLFRALSNHFITLENLDLSNLMQTASKLKIISGLENWQRSINTGLSTDFYDDEYSSSVRNRYQSALQNINSVAEILEPFKKEMTIDNFLSELNKLIVKVKIPQNILSIGGNKTEENIKGLTAFIKAVTEVFRLIESDEGKSKKYNITYFLDQIRTACKGSRFNIKEKSSFGVLVTSLDEIRGLKFDYLFIAGMYDGELPTRYNPEIFFSGSFRKGEEIRLNEERYLFYQALSTWRKKIYFSFPGSDSLRELNESTFLRDFRKTFSTQSLNPESLEKFVFSKEEFFLSGNNNLSDDESGKKKEVGEIIKRNPAEFENALAVISGNISPEEKKLFSGFLIPDSGIEVTEEYKMSAESEKTLSEFRSKIYSASQLEKYASCPFRYFVETVLGLTPFEEPSEDIEAVEFGNLLHKILFLFSVWLREEKIDLRNCDNQTFERTKEKLFDITHLEYQKLRTEDSVGFYEKEKLFGLPEDENEGILHKYLMNEKENAGGFSPKYFEASFGRNRGKHSDPELFSEEPIKVGDVNMRGKIDRIEMSDDSRFFNVVDYKTGSKKVTLPEIENGLYLQLPLYLFAVRETLKNNLSLEVSPGQMFIYSLKFARDNFGKNQIKLTRKKEENYEELNEKLFKSLMERIEEYVNSISSGKFNLSNLPDREQKVCSYCNFKSVCRVLESES